MRSLTIAPGVPQRRLAQSGNALDDLVDVAADELDLRVDHLVNADEVRSDDIPMDVLERQVQVVIGAELLLQRFSDLLALLVRQARNGEMRIMALLHVIRSGTHRPAR